MPTRLPFDNTYARLPAHFHTRINPTPVPSPKLIQLNTNLALFLNLDPAYLTTPEGIAILAGNHIAEASEPLAIAYAGHQFGHFVPQLGDGRANLLGEVIAQDGKRYDIQLKGSGPTPYSRRGDGRAALGPVLREYLLSEAIFALHVPTTRALAAVATGQPVYRETVQPGAIFTRVASSHLRVGTFQYFAARNDREALRTLANYAITRHYPEAAHTAQPYRALLNAVIAKQAHLIAQWLLLGFIHGVMNTDNTSISGETIDYGPCAFMEAYNPAQVYSSIDHQGRYAFSNQPHAAHWNLARLAEALLPLLTEEAGTHDQALTAAYESLATFEPHFESTHNTGLRRKLGLTTEQPGDTALAHDLLTRMAANQADYTLTFRRLAGAVDGDQTIRTLFADPKAYDTWADRWHARLHQEPTTPQARKALMQAASPAIIPRNHNVEEALETAVTHQNLRPFEDLLQAITHPYEEGPERYTTPARPDQQIQATYCGT
jgi:uncharacterized protein YdiU (UPF0061 family)